MILAKNHLNKDIPEVIRNRIINPTKRETNYTNFRADVASVCIEDSLTVNTIHKESGVTKTFYFDDVQLKIGKVFTLPLNH